MLSFFKTILNILVVVYIFSSCVKRDTAGTAVYGVFIHYIDSSKNDLFSTDGTDGYWKDSIKVFDITGAKKPLPNCYENGENFQFQNVDVIRTIICENTDIVNRYSLTLVHLKHDVDDTIKCHINRAGLGLGTSFDGIWYNGILKPFDSTGNITVMK